MTEGDEVDRLRGGIAATHFAVAVAYAEIARMGGRTPEGAQAALDRTLRALEAAVPEVLAVIEDRGPGGVSAGFEEAIETITRIARSAVSFEAGPEHPGPSPDR